MKSIFSISLLIFLLASCKTGSVALNNGNQAFEQKKYVLATSLLKKEIANEGDLFKKIEKLQLLAQAYNEMNSPERQVEALQEIVELDKNPQYLFDLALAQKHNENYEDALENLEQYKALSNDFFNTSAHLKYCEEMVDYKEAQSNIRIENLENINSTSSDYAARPYKKGFLVFTSSRSSSIGDLTQPWDHSKSSDLFMAEPRGDSWGAIIPFGPQINTELAEGVATFSRNFETMYFTRCDYLELGNSFCRIYKTEADGDLWYEPELISIFSDSVNIGQPHLSADGERLYFSSDANFGYGGNDIYFMLKEGSSWSQPYNAGFSINTDKDELFPTTDRSGNLYYSSNGKQGYGGLDIFKAGPDKFAFAPSEILPHPINSGADDFSFSFLKEPKKGDSDFVLEKAVFSSTRKGGKGSDDLYLYEKLFINQYALELLILEKTFADPNDSESKILESQALAGAIVIMKGQESISPADGKLLFMLEAETDYKLLVSKPDYFNKSISFSTKGLRSPDSLLITLFKEVELEKIFPEKEIVIQNIYYDYDKATLRQESLPILDQLVSFFDENKDLTIEIGSHTDSRGSDKYNKDLSQRRAQSVVDYFITKGVPSAQLSAKGYGESKLINRCANGVTCDEEEHQKNRRTTFRVISSDGILESGK